MNRTLVTSTCIITFALGVFAIGTVRVSAYPSYHDPNLNDQGYCTTCHPGFSGGQNDVLHDLHTGGSDPVTTNCDLCHTGSGRNNPLTMWSTGDNDDGLGCTGCHGKDYGETIGADEQGFPITGLPKNSGYGLLKHHADAGIGVCAGCHADVTPLPENVIPTGGPTHYYLRADVSLGGMPVEPCTNEDSANDADTEGLDNDGDDLYDGLDPDCLCADTDVNCDGVTNGTDIGIVGSGANFLQNPPPCDRTDVDGQNGTTGADIGIIGSGANFFTQTCTVPAPGCCVCVTTTPGIAGCPT